MVLLNFFIAAPEDPPKNFTIAVDGLSLHFSWEPPSEDLLVLSYTLSCSVRREIELTAKFKPILNITLDELKPLTPYACTIFSSTSGGNGPPTDEILASTESKWQ